MASLNIADYISPIHECTHENNRRAEEREHIVEHEEFEFDVQLGAVESVEEDGLLPPVALLDEVRDVEGRLLLDHGAVPLDGLALVVVGEGDRPVLADRALEADVETQVALDGRVDDPVGALDAHLAAVEEHEGPLHLQVVFRDADAVTHRHDEVEQLSVFEVGDVAIREGGFLVFEPDQVVFAVAELEHFLAVGDVEVTLLVHVQHPGVGVGADCH